ncbi:MAG: carboxypeptidase [Proteobacteria bacterium]|nr:carboxypeptidase [Pseudomonadota bacterium]
MTRTPLALACASLLTATLALAAPTNETARQADRAHLLQLERADVADVVRVQAPSAELLRRAAVTYHDQMLDYDEAGLAFVARLPAAERQRIEAKGFTTAPATAWLAQRQAQIDGILARAQGASLLGRQAEGGTEAIPNFPCYDTVEETLARIQGWATQYPQLVTLIDIGDSWAKTQGSGGYDLVVLKLTSQRHGGFKPALLVNTGLHARELAPVAVGTDFANKLLTGYGTDADATWILDHHEVHLLLQTNPDGRKHAEAGVMWRKNGNTTVCTARPNAQGVDLNRNFGFSWNSVRGGSSGAQCDETYRGPSAESEPETQALAHYVRALWPDNRGPGMTDPANLSTTGLHIDMHSAASLVLWPWGETKTPSGNATAFQTLGRRMAWYSGYTPEVSIGLYPTDGTSDGPPYGELGVPSYTIELDKTFFEKCSDYTAKTGPDNVATLMYAAKVVREPYVTPGGPDVTAATLPTQAVAAGKRVRLTASATDTRFSAKKGTEPQQAIVAAEAYIDVPPWLPGAKAIKLKAADGQFDATTEGLKGRLDTTGLARGQHMVFVRARDASQTWGPMTGVFLNIR